MKRIICALLFGFTAMTYAGDLPTSKPVSATEVVICAFNKLQILTVIVTCQDGKVLRFNAEDMHGLTVEQMLSYSGQANDTYTMGQKCMGQET